MEDHVPWYGEICIRRWNLISIWQPLPPSIEVIRVVLYSITAQYIYSLMRNPPDDTSMFPGLRSTVLRVDYTRHVSSSQEMFELVKPLDE